MTQRPRNMLRSGAADLEVKHVKLISVPAMQAWACLETAACSKKSIHARIRTCAARTVLHHAATGLLSLELTSHSA